MTDLNIQTSVDADGILLATIDMPGRAMNVFSGSMMDSLEALITRVQADKAVTGVVLTSAKPTFLAGADLEMIQMFTERARTGTTAELRLLFGRLGRLFRRMELSPKPFVAAINGLALGGGLEVCLACHARVVADDAKIQLGLPEIKLGLLPGAGGTQRLPRIVGTAKGLEMLLTGAAVAPAEALSLGLVSEMVPGNQLIAAATARARSLVAPQAPWDVPGATFEAAPFDFSNPEAAFAAVAAAVNVSDEQRRHYPAYNAILECVVGGWNQPMSEAAEHEMAVFIDLMRDPVAGNMVRCLFLNRQKAAKQGLLAAESPFATGDDALLPRLTAAKSQANTSGADETGRLLLGAAAALACWQAGKAEPEELADVAAVNAGLYPAYTGGPLNWLVQTGAAGVAAHVQHAPAEWREALAPLDALGDFLARHRA
jgi:enoyl-CoA hydratase/carnithine racemase